MGEAEVRIVVRKFDGRIHRHVAMTRLGEDEYGVWLGAPVGTMCHESAKGLVYATAERRVVLVPHDAWWTALFQDAPAQLDVYCDVAVPAEWPHPAEVITVDLDLDVCRARADGSVFVEDEDEFARNQVRYGYPQNVVARARATSRWLSAALGERAEPFGSRYRSWLELT